MISGNAGSGAGHRPAPRARVTQARQPPIVAAQRAYVQRSGCIGVLVRDRQVDAIREASPATRTTTTIHGSTSHNGPFESDFAPAPNKPKPMSSTAPTVIAESATLNAGNDHACQ